MGLTETPAFGRPRQEDWKPGIYVKILEGRWVERVRGGAGWGRVTEKYNLLPQSYEVSD